MEVFPLYYAGNLGYYESLLAADTPMFELWEHFPKQTYRNRMEILGPNGVQKLVIPTVKTGARRTYRDVQISYAERWQKDHWKSLEAAYRRSPYFEFYEDRFKPLYTNQMEKLVDFNLALHNVIMSLLQINHPAKTTTQFELDIESKNIYEWNNYQVYAQVFSDRHPFASDLSILDALFNLGPRTIGLIQ
jgi:hypothetical protein